MRPTIRTLKQFRDRLAFLKARRNKFAERGVSDAIIKLEDEVISNLEAKQERAKKFLTRLGVLSSVQM